jgi:hypothetical protein
MMDELNLNPILEFFVRIFISGCYFKKPALLDKYCYMILEHFYERLSH